MKATFDEYINMYKNKKNQTIASGHFIYCESSGLIALYKWLLSECFSSNCNTIYSPCLEFDICLGGSYFDGEDWSSHLEVVYQQYVPKNFTKYAGKQLF